MDPDLNPGLSDSKVYLFNYYAILLNKSMNSVTIGVSLYVYYINMHICKYRYIVMLIAVNYGGWFICDFFLFPEFSTLNIIIE